MSENAAFFFIDRNLELGRADRIAVCSAQGEVTYAALAGAVTRAGNHLRRLGVLPERRVLLLLNDGPEFIYFFMAALKIGAVAVPVNTFCRADLLAYYLTDTRAPVLVTHESYRGKVEQASREAFGFLEHVVYVDAKEWNREPEMLREFDVGPDDSAFWLYTSGSTGPQKAVVHRHGGLKSCAQHYGASVLKIEESDRCYSTSKMFFAYGLGNSVIFPLSVGASCVLNEGPNDCATVASLILTFRPTLFFSVPALYKQLLACGQTGRELFAGVRLCISAGEYLPASLHQAWVERTGVATYDGIGSTEAMHIFCSNQQGAERPGTSGVPVEGYDLKVVDEQGRQVGSNEVGRLMVRGKTVAKGYWNKHDATQKSFQGEWLATGDIYRVTDEGFYQYVGRQDDVFKSHGLWVSSSEIEQVLLSSPYVKETAVIASQGNGGFFAAHAFVVPSDEAVKSEPDDLRRDIYEHLCAHLSKYKIPESIVILPALPKTATGKIARAELRQMS